MRVRLAKLSSNPWRDPDRYPFDAARLEALRTSIKATGFWDNLLARPDGSGGYQIAYGHHRLAVAKEELGENYEADIPVKDLSDADMLKIMVQENETLYPHEIGVLKENILATKRFFTTENGKRIYAEIKKRLGVSPPPKHPERKIYANFLAIPENRVRMGLGIAEADNERMERALSEMDKPAGTHAQVIVESVGDDKETTAVFAEVVRDQDLSTRETKNIAHVLKFTDKKDRAKVLSGVKKRSKSISPEAAARKAQIKAVSAKQLLEMGEHLNADSALDDYSMRLIEMNTALVDLLALWPHLKRSSRRLFKGAITNTFRILNENSDLLKKGGNHGKHLPEKMEK